MALAAVVFDLDDTLVDEMAALERSRAAVARLVSDRDVATVSKAIETGARRIWRAGPHHGLALELGIASWEGLWATFEGGHERLDGLKAWIRKYQEAAWAAALAELGIVDDALAAQMGAAFLASQLSGHRLLEGAAELVRGLAGRVRLGLLTNGPPDIQRHKLEGTGLASLFEVVVVSGERGIGKPNPAVFAIVQDALEVEAEQMLMVGDSWGRDVEGALGARWSAIWLAGGRPAPAEPDGVRVVEAIGDVAALPEVASLMA